MTSYFTPPRLNIPAWHETETGQAKLAEMAALEDERIAAGELPPHYIYYMLGRK